MSVPFISSQGFLISATVPYDRYDFQASHFSRHYSAFSPLGISPILNFRSSFLTFVLSSSTYTAPFHFVIRYLHDSRALSMGFSRHDTNMQSERTKQDTQSALAVHMSTCGH